MEKKALDGEVISQEAISLDEAQQLKSIMQDFMTAYVQNQDKEVAEWLPQKLQASLGVSLEEAQAITQQLVATIKYNEESARSLAEAKSRGMTREAWVSKVIREDVQDLPEEEQKKRLAEVYAAFEEVNASVLGGENGAETVATGEELEETVALFDPETRSILRIDFSVVNDVRYYNGTVFKGFVKDVPVGVLSGGRYDKLLEKFGRKAGAIGFAVYLDALERMEDLRPFDVDVLLLYGEKEDLATVRMWARDLMQSGKSVQVQRAIPEDLRYQKLMKIEEGRLILLEEYA